MRYQAPAGLAHFSSQVIATSNIAIVVYAPFGMRHTTLGAIALADAQSFSKHQSLISEQIQDLS